MITKEIIDQYEPTIGIECHVQLQTVSKLFSGADNDARDASPNTTVSPICFGLPGTLPVLNEKAVRLAIRAGLALNAEIAHISSFDRKHYFYPDLPKGYQITQLERPIVGIGEIKVPMPEGGESFTVRITRAHLEEDAGKLTHPGGSDYSLVDLNRAGTPLIEIVSEADMHSPAQAKAYAQELYLLMTYAGVTIGDLYHGNMRFDVNISVAKKGSGTLGTRAEIKNLNSFRSVEKAAEFEIGRQIELLERGDIVVQETRGWNEAKQVTVTQRSKENAHDYRYFPDADIPPIEVTAGLIDEISQELPLLPPEIREKFSALGLNPSQISALLIKKYLADQLLEVIAKSDDATALKVANWLSGEILRIVSEADFDAGQYKVTSSQLISLARMVNDNKLSSTNAKEVLQELIADDKANPEEIATRKNLLQVSDAAAIEAVVDQVLQDPVSQKAIEDIRSGNDKAISYLVGQVMKLSRGQANPAMATTVIKQKIQ